MTIVKDLEARGMHHCETTAPGVLLRHEGLDLSEPIMLSGLDLTGVVITADALHTQHTHAQQIVRAGGHYLFIVKGNQPTLLSRLKALPWRQAILNDRTDETGHGRREIRRMKIRRVRPGPPFPHAAQAIQVKRRRTGHRCSSATRSYSMRTLRP